MVWNCSTVRFARTVHWLNWCKPMSKDYGMMIGCNSSITWVKNLQGVNDSIKYRVLARMAYEFDKDIPVKPKLHKGIYGSKFDHYTCGNCGATIDEAYYNFCPNCGFRIAKTPLHEKQREEFTQLTLDDFLKVGE